MSDKWKPAVGDMVYRARHWDWNDVAKGTLKPARVLRVTDCFVWVECNWASKGNRLSLDEVYPDLRTLALRLIDHYQNLKSSHNREADSCASKIAELRKACQ